MKKTLLPCLLIISILSSCTRYAYYQSPTHANASAYRAMPMIRDSAKAKLYLSGSFIGGLANQRLRDNINGFNASAHVAHHFGNFQAYYGLTGTLGSYKIDSTNGWFNTNEDGYPSSSLLNSMTGRKSFRSYGAFGGVNGVIPFSGGEWRFLGTEFTYTKEFGQYLDFRQKLPVNAANLVDQRNHFFTAGLSTDLVLRRSSNSIGFRVAGVMDLATLNVYYQEDNPRVHRSYYFVHTIHFEKNRVTGYFQGVTGIYAFTIQGGANIRIGK
ncbi:MAG TPA: hypothetical protein VK666_11335 [Chryseolinea sp.]|nr:hypothetical protein [Chryseolinea sp.]